MKALIKHYMGEKSLLVNGRKISFPTIVETASPLDHDGTIRVEIFNEGIIFYKDEWELFETLKVKDFL